MYYFDLLGYGQSDKSNADVSLGIENRLLDALIDHWKISSPFIIGHDFGGTTVFRNHLLDKRNYKKIVVIDPVALSPWGSSLFKHIQKHEAAFAEVPDYIHLAIVEAYIKTAAYQPLNQETIDGILAPWADEDGRRAFYRQMAQADSKYTDDFQELFSEITTALLILWGEEDSWIPCEHSHLLHSKIPNSKLSIIPNTGHLIIEENPIIVIKEIREFLEK